MRPLLPALLLIALLVACAPVIVERGDSVFITYTGSFHNGTVFDTNDPANSALFPDAPASKFAPMLVKIGDGKLIPGFENALIGMTEGETRNVTVKAAQAYGGYDPDKVRKVPHIVTFPIEDAVPRTVPADLGPIRERLGDDVRIGAVIETTNFRYNITRMNATHALLYLIEPRTDPITLEGRGWSSALVSSNASTLVFRARVDERDTIRAPEGTYDITVDDDTITLTSQYAVGAVVTDQAGAQGRVTGIKDGKVIIDFNHPLAGFDLTFSIRVDTLQPRSEA